MELIAMLLYIVVAVTSTAVYFLHRSLSYWKKLNIPHEEPHAIVGNMKGNRSSLHMDELYGNCYKEFKGSGPFAGFYILQRPAVVLLEKETIQQILNKDFKYFIDRGMYYNKKTDPLTGHLFFSDGQKWSSLRTKLAPTFTSGKMKFMYPTLVKVTAQFMDVLTENVKKNSILEVRYLLGRFTVDIIGSFAFGIECNSLKNPKGVVLKFGCKSIVGQRHNFVVMNIIDSFPQLSRKLGMRILPEDVHQFFIKTVKDTIKYGDEHKIQRSDFLNMLIDIKNSEDPNSELNGLNVEEIASQVFVFFLVVFENSSSTMAFALHELAQNYEIQNRLRNEANKLFEIHKDSEVPYGAIMNPQYESQVLTETLRKYPTVSNLNRKALSDYVIPVHPKYIIQKDTPVIILILGIQYDPEFYPNPKELDSDCFSPEMVKECDSTERLPFGDGPRNCIDMRFGQMQSRLGLASVAPFPFFGVP